LQATEAHETRRLKTLRRRGLLAFSQTLVETKSDESRDGDTDECVEDCGDLVDWEMEACDKVELSRDLIDRAWRDLVSQYNESSNYLYHHAPGLGYLVRRITWEIPPTNTPQTVHLAHVPKFDRTRVVTISNSKLANLSVSECHAS
jgi:hypothetical protein